MLYESRNAVSVTGLIIDSVHYLTLIYRFYKLIINLGKDRLFRWGKGGGGLGGEKTGKEEESITAFQEGRVGGRGLSLPFGATFNFCGNLIKF